MGSDFFISTTLGHLRRINSHQTAMRRHFQVIRPKRRKVLAERVEPVAIRQLTSDWTALFPECNLGFGVIKRDCLPAECTRQATMRAVEILNEI